MSKYAGMGKWHTLALRSASDYNLEHLEKIIKFKSLFINVLAGQSSSVNMQKVALRFRVFRLHAYHV
jgi:hypothetical protein